MYFRTAYRHEPEFAIGQVSRTPSGLEEGCPPRMIDNDVRVSANYQRLVGQAFGALFTETDETVGAVALREQLIGQLREALARVLPDIELGGLVDPTASGTFQFSKGVANGFPTCSCQAVRRQSSTYCLICSSSRLPFGHQLSASMSRRRTLIQSSTASYLMPFWTWRERTVSSGYFPRINGGVRRRCGGRWRCG